MVLYSKTKERDTFNLNLHNENLMNYFLLEMIRNVSEQIDILYDLTLFLTSIHAFKSCYYIIERPVKRYTSSYILRFYFQRM